jgi:hypothetical protein
MILRRWSVDILFLGNPSRDSSYRDGRGFVRAQVMRAYDVAGDTTPTSLQLSLLRLDVNARVLELERLISDVRWIDFGLYRMPLSKGYFCDHCVLPVPVPTRQTASIDITPDGSISWKDRPVAIDDARWSCDIDRGCRVEDRKCDSTSGIAHKCSQRQGCVSSVQTSDAWDTMSADIEDSSLLANKGYAPAHIVAPTARYPTTSSEYNLEKPYLRRGNTTSTKTTSVPPQAAPSPSSSPSDPPPVPLKRAPSRYSWTKENLVRGSVLVKHWNPETPFVDWIVNYDQPVIFRNTIVDRWPAREKWTPSYLSQHIGTDKVLTTLLISNWSNIISHA